MNESLTNRGAEQITKSVLSIYDLSGRRVKGTPKKGGYIQNGKKVVIK